MCVVHVHECTCYMHILAKGRLVICGGHRCIDVYNITNQFKPITARGYSKQTRSCLRVGDRKRCMHGDTTSWERKANGKCMYVRMY